MTTLESWRRFRRALKVKDQPAPSMRIKGLHEKHSALTLEQEMGENDSLDTSEIAEMMHNIKDSVIFFLLTKPLAARMIDQKLGSD